MARGLGSWVKLDHSYVINLVSVCVANQYSSNLRCPYICCYIQSTRMLDMFYFILASASALMCCLS